MGWDRDLYININSSPILIYIELHPQVKGKEQGKEWDVDAEIKVVGYPDVIASYAQVQAHLTSSQGLPNTF